MLAKIFLAFLSRLLKRHSKTAKMISIKIRINMAEYGDGRSRDAFSAVAM